MTKKLPLSFRQDLCAKLFQLVQASESASIVGTSGVGKSNLFNHLLDLDTQRHYLGDDAANYILVRVDGNQLLSLELLALYGLFLDGLEKIDSPPYDVDFIVNQHDAMLDKADHLQWVRRHFERALGSVMQDPARRLIFLFDQFDYFYQNADDLLFRALRGLRETYKYRLSFLMFVRDPLSKDVEFNKDKEEFYELLNTHTLGIGLYNESDCFELISRITRRNELTISNDIQHELYRLSGGHAGLLRALVFAYICHETTNINDLITYRPIQDECQKIWNCIGEDEHEVLFELFSGYKTEHKKTLALLQLRGLVTAQQQIFSEVFSKFLATLDGEHSRTLRFDAKRRFVIVRGKISENLSETEFNIFKCLYENADEVVSRQELARAGWPNHVVTSHKGYDAAINTNLNRLRGKIEINPAQPEFIETVPKRGVRLNVN